MDLLREVSDKPAILVQNVTIHDGKRRWSWALGSRARRAVHDDHRLRVPSRPQKLGDYISSGLQATSYDKSDQQSSATTDQDSIDDYPIIRVSPEWDPNNKAWRIRIIRCSNREAINFFSKYPAINKSMMTKCGSSSSGHTPPQLGLQHGPTVGPSLRGKSGLPLQNRCALSDRQATHHHLKNQY
jgi:hypothetical protein